MQPVPVTTWRPAWARWTCLNLSWLGQLNRNKNRARTADQRRLLVANLRDRASFSNWTPGPDAGPECSSKTPSSLRRNHDLRTAPRARDHRHEWRKYRHASDQLPLHQVDSTARDHESDCLYRCTLCLRGLNGILRMQGRPPARQIRLRVKATHTSS